MLRQHKLKDEPSASREPLHRELLTAAEVTLPLLSDLTMLAIGGRERTEAEYRSLLAAADLDLRSVISSDSPYCLLEATPR